MRLGPMLHYFLSTTIASAESHALTGSFYCSYYNKPLLALREGGTVGRQP